MKYLLMKAFGMLCKVYSTGAMPYKPSTTNYVHVPVPLNTTTTLFVVGFV